MRIGSRHAMLLNMYVVEFIFGLSVFLQLVFLFFCCFVSKITEVSEIDVENCDDTALRCLVCLEEYGQDQVVLLLGCGHRFHIECVERLFESGIENCPACRACFIER